jgi:hypothetical protein
MARSPRPRRQVRPATLRLARIFGFRFDDGRDAYVLRLVGGRIGPVIRTKPHDMAAEQLEWSGAMDDLAARRKKTGRFTRDPERRQRLRRDVVKR